MHTWACDPDADYVNKQVSDEPFPVIHQAVNDKARTETLFLR